MNNKNGSEKKNVLYMIDDLEQFYEAAGFCDFYERVLSKMNEEEIRTYHYNTFSVMPEEELIEWGIESKNEERKI